MRDLLGVSFGQSASGLCKFCFVQARFLVLSSILYFQKKKNAKLYVPVDRDFPVYKPLTFLIHFRPETYWSETRQIWFQIFKILNPYFVKKISFLQTEFRKNSASIWVDMGI